MPPGAYLLAPPFHHRPSEGFMCYGWQTTLATVIRSPQFTAGFILGVVHPGMLDTCIRSCIHHYGFVQNSFTAMKSRYSLHSHLSPLLPQVLPLPECPIVGITHCEAFSGWFLSLRNMHLRFLHVFSWLDSSFLFQLNNLLFNNWMDHSLHMYTFTY